MTILHYLFGRSPHGDINTKSLLPPKNLIKNLNKVLLGETNLINSITDIGLRNINRINNDETVIGEVLFKQGNYTFSD